MKKLVLSSLGFLFLFGLNRCSVEKNYFIAVSPPLKNVNVKFAEFKIDSSVGDTLHCSSGTSIIIPKDAFIDTNGKPYKGELIIKYREFHNSTDILASGITMTYDSAGQKQEFQTAGMFEIIASKPNNTKVNLATDKQVEVNMASYVNGSAYNFYYLDEKVGWQCKGKKEVEINNEKQKLIAQLSDSITPPVKPNNLNANQKVFNLSFDEKIHPELKSFSDVVWQYSGVAGDSIHDPALNPWVYVYSWEKADLGKYNDNRMDFELSLTAYNKKFSTTVKPVLTGEKLKNALQDFNEKLKIYIKEKERKKNAVQLVEKQGDFVRSFSIKKFGIYNWDCALRQPNRIVLQANITFDTEIDISEKDIQVYLVTGSDRSLVQYSYNDLANFSFDPGASNKLVVILPGNKIAVFDEEQFKQLDITQIKHYKTCSFQLQVRSSAIKSMDELSNALSS